MNRRSLAIVSAIAVAVLLHSLFARPIAFRGPSTTSLSQTSERAARFAGAKPVICVWRFPGYQPSALGLEIAIWSDGAVLAAAARNRPGENIMIGKVAPAQVDTALTAVRESGFFNATSLGVRVDAASTLIRVRDGTSERAVEWDESFIPVAGGELSDSAIRKFVATWNRTRAAIEAIAIESAEPLEKRVGARGVFRGYKLGAAKPPAWVLDG